MVEERIKKAVGLIKDFLKQRNIKIDRVIVFGSQIKGKIREDSDIDIAIISSDFDGKDIFQKTEMLKGLKWEIVGEFMLPFDIIPISLKEWKESSSLIVEYIKEGNIAQI
jgi:predicted nucleotidyltransferase